MEIEQRIPNPMADQPAAPTANHEGVGGSPVEGGPHFVNPLSEKDLRPDRKRSRNAGDRFGFGLGRVGRRFASCYAAGIELRRQLERAVRQRVGRLELSHVSRVQSAVRLEVTARILELETSKTPNLSLGQLMEARKLLAQICQQRDSIIAELLGKKRSHHHEKSGGSIGDDGKPLNWNVVDHELEG